MKLTPLDIRHKEFRRGLRGYSDEEVDVFLDEVADDFERLYQENEDLLERMKGLEEQVAQYVGLKETLQKTLITAQQQSDELRENARKEAGLALRDAELRSRDIVAEAEAERQRVKQSLGQLELMEQDFRSKFKSLLDRYADTLAKDELSEDRERIHGVVAGVVAGAELDPEAVGSAPDPAAKMPSEATAGPRSEAVPAVLAASVASTGTISGGPGPEPPSDAPSDAPAARDTEGPHWLSDYPAAGASEAEDTVPPPAAEGGEPASAEDAEELDQGATLGKKPSSVRRFLFGSKAEEEDEFFTDKEDRDFKW
jgi:cell division initiation protein